MSISTSSNCAAYTNTVSLLVVGEATVPGKEATCSVTVPPMFSCQTEEFERPDSVTEGLMRGTAAKMLPSGCDASLMEMQFKTNLVGAQRMEYSAEKLSELGLASNCFAEGNDINHATHRFRSQCKNQYDFTMDGQRVRNTDLTFTSTLHTCDMSDGAMKQLEEDGRKVAAYYASEQGYVPDRVEDFKCIFSALPVG